MRMVENTLARSTRTKKHGEGQMVYASGNEYKGQYNDGKKHGRGTFKFIKSGNVYTGDYYEDKKAGHGEFLWKNGTKYVGQWQDDNMTGKGIKTRKDGSVIHDGMWKDDKPV
mmetsp:Transcript_34684/g.54145  ORF Transcript_34684/g.54145 Transcript_34684/m.54145 type:complete len:112 (+) Transcript_34684:738-1073(+)